MDNEKLLEEWKKGWKKGVDSVFQFLREMGKVNQSYKLEEEYEAWANADEYTKFDGEVVKRYE